MVYTERTSCRLCNGELKPIISLGDIHLSTFVDTNDAQSPKVPLDLTICTECNLMQLRHTVNGDAMYSEYWYQSGLNKSMVAALHDVVDNVNKRVFLSRGDIVLDIGANDGTLLSFYNREVVRRVAIEPSNLASLAFNKADVVINDYFSADVYNRHIERKAKVITAIAMFYDLEDPHSFVQDLKDILAYDGIIVIQMMDLMSMLRYGDFPNLCHEHLEYYSLAVFKKLMEQHDLDVFDVEYNGVNGGSLRAYIAHKGVKAISSVVEQALLEEDAFLDHIGDSGEYFKQKIEEVRAKVVSFIRENKDKKIAVLGASTKGNTVLQYFALTADDIDHAAEINPDKYGKFTIGSNIPIIPEKESLAMHPDYYLVLPWGFIDNFIISLYDYLKRGGKFIVPLPDPRIIELKDGNIWNQTL